MSHVHADCPFPTTRWKHPQVNRSFQELLSHELRIHPIVSQILVNRSIVSPDDARRYLSPSLSDLHNPFLMKDMKEGVSRLIKAIHENEKIVIYGDYDVDGITSVVILFKFLRILDATVSYRIPDRFREGYSLNRQAIDEMKGIGTSLIITVDCGTSDYDHIRYASSLGMDSIILDHHEIPDKVPSASAVVNTNRSDCRFPFKRLAGVGIVFNFLIALRATLREEGYWTDRTYPNLRSYLDLVALGTIGDISQLTEDNRIFAKIGLDLINEDKNIGIRALKDISGLKNQIIGAGSASYNLIPRLNAAGRIASADDAVRLLLTDDLAEAKSIARKLDAFNLERQGMERKIVEQILTEIETTKVLEKYRSLIFSSNEWHPGVIGIVASRLVEMFYRPAILISLKDGIGKGSGRSISEFNLHNGLSKCQSLLISHGGHRFAAGLSIKEEHIDTFRIIFDKYLEQEVSPDLFFPETIIDAQCSLSDISHDLISQIEFLAPFGNKNPEPVLCTGNVKVGRSSVVGKNHLAMKFSADGTYRNSIWFNKGHLNNKLTESSFDIAFTPQLNNWNGVTNVQLKIKDMAISNSR
jgi:single-stranded-DNA-specific exonuclease